LALNGGNETGDDQPDDQGDGEREAVAQILDVQAEQRRNEEIIEG
jgi:hypothetical protein